MTGLVLASALLVAASPGAAAAVSPEAARHVVVVGVNESVDPGVAPLAYADDDAARYVEALGAGAASLEVLAVLDADTQPLFPEVAARAEPPTRASLRRALERTFARIEADREAGRDADLVFVFVGHGAVGPDGEGYVSLLDEKFTRGDLFREVIAASPARFNHVIVDACSAYHLLHRGKNQVLAVRRLLQKSSLKSYPNTGVLLSTSSDVETHEWSRIRGGVFSHEVLSALSGAADVDSDGTLSYEEVGAFIEAANAKVEDRRAKIDFFIRPPPLFVERPVVGPSEADRGPPRLALAERDAGHFVVEDARGVVLAEVNKNKEQPLAIRLVGRAPFRVVRGEDAWKTGDRPTGTLKLSRLDKDPTAGQLASRSAVIEALERGLFQQPFGKSYVDGYGARLRRDLEAELDPAAAPAQASLTGGPPSSSSASGAGPAEAPGEGGFPWLATAGGTVLAMSLLSGAGAVLTGILAASAGLQLQAGAGVLDAFEAQGLMVQTGGFGLAAAGLGALTAGLLGGGGLLLASEWLLDEEEPDEPDDPGGPPAGGST